MGLSPVIFEVDGLFLHASSESIFCILLPGHRRSDCRSCPVKFNLTTIERGDEYAQYKRHCSEIGPYAVSQWPD